MPKIKLLLVSLLLSAITSAQTTSSKQAIVQQTIIKLFTALSNSDTAGLKLHSTSNVKFYEYGQIWTIDTMIQKMMVMSKAEDFKRINSFEFVNTTINKKIAWVTYYLQSTITRNNQQEIINWMETVILLKEKNQWKITVLHSTRLVKN
ncbi:MAG: nuclear transport factor 2 family protein [Bacteroidia bacterium]|nr:nuclear transport factor 2 family protein [Bacteroidia bacterium]